MIVPADAPAGFCDSRKLPRIPRIPLREQCYD